MFVRTKNRIQKWASTFRYIYTAQACRVDQKWSHIARQLPYSSRNVVQCALYSYSALFWEKAIVLNFYVFTIMLRLSVTAFIFKLHCNCIDPPPTSRNRLYWQKNHLKNLYKCSLKRSCLSITFEERHAESNFRKTSCQLKPRPFPVMISWWFNDFFLPWNIVTEFEKSYIWTEKYLGKIEQNYL